MTCGEATDAKNEGKGLSRRQSRRKSFELLFELEHRPDLTIDGILDRTFNNEDVAEQYLEDLDEEGYVVGRPDTNASRYIRELVCAVKDHEADLDRELARYPHDWSYDRIGTLERVLLKLALAEMVYIGTSYKVVINEILDMAKLYAQEEARRFINGILGAVVRNLDNLRSAANEGQDG